MVMSRVEEATERVAISSVNFCEVVGKLVRDGVPASQVYSVTQLFRKYVVAFSIIHAECAGEIHRTTQSHGLSLGDRACLALAMENDATVLTGDRVWKQLDIGVRVELIRK